ncbi:MAG: SMC-Scp complex subunit ScpB [Clostridia bacterium]|nr:SMC-Scp complex subunit ScpB [Clostridia bacterium]
MTDIEKNDLPTAANETEKTASVGDIPPLEGVAEIEAAIEAILFAAGYPVKYDKLSEVLGLTVTDIKRFLEHMAPAYNDSDSTRGIQLLLLPETAQLCTKERFAPYIREALGVRRGGNLSASSMEVLAVVAYNQPVTRTFIDSVRGVDSSYAVNSLLDKGLIEAVGRLDVVGRPMLYATTDKFLRVFGINSLADLPATEALSVAAEVQEQKSTEQSENASEPTDSTESAGE